MANVFAQAEALAFGKTADEVRGGRTPEWLVPHRVFQGNRPSTTHPGRPADAAHARYAGRAVRAQRLHPGVIWGSTLRQWGVELGKVLAQRIGGELQGSGPPVGQATIARRLTLIRRYLQGRGPRAREMTQPTDAIDTLCINTLRTLSIDAVEKAASGHPGLPMGAATMAYVLWTRHLRCDPSAPEWINRDRFVLSAGHGSMLLYSLLFMTGYGLTIEDLQHFRRWGSRTPGHPERGVTTGVEVTTGPLGQGFGNAVGMAMAERWLAATFNRPGHTIVDHHTYVIASDGDLMEGIASEAASLAGDLHLGRLIVLYDANKITLSATTNITFSEDVAARFAAYGWQVQEVDGMSVTAVDAALTAARADEHRPSLIVARTHIGFGSPNKHDTFEAHGEPLGANEVRLTKTGVRLARRRDVSGAGRRATRIR